MIRAISQAEIPVSVEEIQRHIWLGDEATDQDLLLIEQYIRSAVDHGERLTGRSFSPRQFRLTLPDVENPIELMPDVISVESVSLDGVVLAPEKYQVNDDFIGSIQVEGSGKVQVDFTAGYTQLPHSLKLWVFTRVAGMYEQREEFFIGKEGETFRNMPKSFVSCMLEPFIVPGFGAKVFS